MAILKANNRILKANGKLLVKPKDDLPNCLAMVLGDQFDDNGLIVPNYNRGIIAANTIDRSSIDTSTFVPTFPLNADYPVLSLKMVNKSLYIDFSSKDFVSLEYYYYRKGSNVVHPQIKNNGKNIGFSTEGYYGIFFVYYDDTGTRRVSQFSNYGNWFHCLIEIDRINGIIYPYINGSLLSGTFTCEKSGNVGLIIYSTPSGYWNAGPAFSHVSLWNKRLSEGRSNFNPEDLYRDWGIIQ